MCGASGPEVMRGRRDEYSQEQIAEATEKWNERAVAPKAGDEE